MCQPLRAVGFAFPGYCCYCSCALQLFFFFAFYLLAFSAAHWMSAALLLQLLSVQPTCSPMPVSSPVASNQLFLCKPFSLQCQHTGFTLGMERPILSVRLAFIPKDPSFPYILDLSSLQSHPRAETPQVCADCYLHPQLKI